MFKRPLDIYDTSPASSTPPHPAQKRRRLSPSIASSSPLQSTSLSTPYTIPSDSPTNPFGRFRSHILSLPKSTSFSRHLPLRFQLIRDRGNEKGEGVYRIVQVPLNYTFKLLLKLVLFLFGGHPKVDHGSSSSKKTGRKETSKNREVESGDGEQKCVFEVQKRITLHREAYRPGQIRSAKTWAKVCPARDELDEEDDEDDPEERGWSWRSEDDFTLGHVWPKGGDLERGITYHHDPHTQIHITVNTQALPYRKGVSNQPYIFRGRGIVYLRPNALPPPTKLFPTLDSPERKMEVEDEDEAPTYPLLPAPVNWNRDNVFHKYLKRTCEVARDHLLTTESPDTNEEDGDFDVSASTLPDFTSSPMSMPSTPYPPNSSAQQVKRVEHASRKILRSARLVRDPESEEDEEVDELDDDL